MEDILLVCLLASFLILGYVQMDKVDRQLKTICHRRDILIVYDDHYQNMQDFSSERIICLSKYELWDLSKPYMTVLICTQEDQYNLLLNYRIKNSMNDCQVYATCHEKEYLNLYLKEKINVIENNEELHQLVRRLYGKDRETAH
ncbi:hypothetical protein H6A03_05025 [[Clostridium] spiroforme]|nr:hypothetical protein [Thomasclavelia spiroformis]MBM6880135.1 hypothetical protein [Thomasclavelia spiroformis]